MPANVVRQPRVDVVLACIEPDATVRVDKRGHREGTQQDDVRVGIHEEVCAQLLGNGQLDQLLQEPASNGETMDTNPGIRS